MVKEYVHPSEAEPDTSSEPVPEHAQEPEPEPQTQPVDVDSPVKTHILFHKALITDDEEDDDKLDKYMEIVEQLEHGMTIAFPNPFDRAIAITFQLAFEHHLDPWDIDLARFSTEYLKHVRKDKNLDLVTAGRIILMAWKILKLQSDEVLLNAQQIQEQEEEYWHEPDGDWYLNDDDFEFTTEVINGEDPPVHEMIWRKGKRRVSLLELVGAFEEAKREAKLIQTLNERHTEERERLKLFRNKNIAEKVHQESLQDDMEMIYKRICKHNGHPIPLSSIYEIELDDKITTLVSTLFLANSRMINIWQRKFPFGQIFVKNLHHEELEEDLEKAEKLGLLAPLRPQDVIEIEVDSLEGLRALTPDEIQELEKSRAKGVRNNGKVPLREINFEDMKNKGKKKLKKLKPEKEEYIISRKKIAS
ncbi:segregation/condensation protein A [[Eubacterium] cellulosolvens]